MAALLAAVEVAPLLVPVPDLLVPDLREGAAESPALCPVPGPAPLRPAVDVEYTEDEGAVDTREGPLDDPTADRVVARPLTRPPSVSLSLLPLPLSTL